MDKNFKTLKPVKPRFGSTIVRPDFKSLTIQQGEQEGRSRHSRRAGRGDPQVRQEIERQVDVRRLPLVCVSIIAGK